MTYYKHTQPGWAILAIVGVSAAITLAWAFAADWNPTLLIVTAAQLLVMWLFASLAVEIDDAELLLKFGPGLIRKRWPLAAIASCHAVRTAWWHGLGIHFTPHGWLYNVSGLHAVELRLRDGKRLRIGTDVPHELERAVGRAIHEHDPGLRRRAP